MHPQLFYRIIEDFLNL